MRPLGDRCPRGAGPGGALCPACPPADPGGGKDHPHPPGAGGARWTFPSGPSSSTGPPRRAVPAKPSGPLLDQFYQEGDRRAGTSEGQDFLKTPEPRPGTAGAEDGPPGESAGGHRPPWERDRMYGDLITANLYRMTGGKAVLPGGELLRPGGGGPSTSPGPPASPPAERRPVL